MSEFLHALATGVIIAAIYFVIERMGYLESKSFGQKMLVLLPVYFVAILLMNFVWPYPT